MKNPEFVERKDLLSIRPVPELLPEQLNHFTIDNLRAKPVGYFDAVAGIEALQHQENQRVIAVDLGGNKVTAVPFRVSNGLLQPDVPETRGIQSSSGVGYLQFLEEVSHEAVRSGIPVGVSFAGFIEGTRALAGPNVSKLMEELSVKYNGDFANLFPTLKSLSNDAVAGIVAGAVEARRQLPQTEQVIYIINGSGLGGAVLKDNHIIATEPGHIPVVDRLNPFGQDRPCGVFGAQHVCIELVAASKVGVADLWAKNTGEQLDGKQIGDRYMQGQTLAGDLYDNSAILTAHVIRGLANAFNLLRQPNDTAVAGYGGIFNVPGYGERVRQILQKNLGYQPSVLLTKDFSANACAEGAAIVALTMA